MNRLIIVGNGFDMAFGYKTSVEQFLTWLLTEEISKSQIFTDYRSTFIEFSANYHLFEPINLTQLKKMPLRELFETFFPKLYIWKSSFLEGVLKKGQSKGWYEIEASYYKSLQGLFALPGATNDKALKKLNAEMEQLVQKLNEYLLTQNEPRELDNEQIVFLKGLGELNEISGFSQADIEKMIFVNFNYTDILKHAITQVKYYNEPEIIHVHGRLNGSDNEPILVGYGDDMDINFSRIENSKNMEAAKFIKSFHYERNESYSKLFDICESDEFNVYILGHSCGTTDKTLLKSLVEHRNCKKIRLFHKGNYDDFFKRNVALSRYFENKQDRRFKMLAFDIDDVMPTLTKSKMTVHG